MTLMIPAQLIRQAGPRGQLTYIAAYLRYINYSVQRTLSYNNPIAVCDRCLYIHEFEF
jgi:hypothetical protein